MPPAYKIDVELGCIFVKWSGVVTAHDIIEFNREIEKDPGYRSGLNRLVDLRQSTFRMSAQDIKEVVGHVFKKRDTAEGPRKGAMVVGRDLEYGLLRMVNALTDQMQSEMRPFRRIEEAVVWLGLSETLGDPFETLELG